MKSKTSRPILAGSIIVLVLIALSSVVFLLQPPFYISAKDERPSADGLWSRLTEPMKIYSPSRSGWEVPLAVDEVEIREESSTVKLVKLSRDFVNFGEVPPPTFAAGPDSQTIKLDDGVVVRMKSVIHGFPAKKGWAETSVDPVSGDIRVDEDSLTGKSEIAWIKTISEIESKTPPLVSPLEIRDTGTHVEVGILGGAIVAPIAERPGFNELTTLHDAVVLHPTTVTIGIRLETRGEPVSKSEAALEIGELTKIGDVDLRLIAKLDGWHRIVKGQWWRDDETALELHQINAETSSSCLIFAANGPVGDLDWLGNDSLGEFHAVSELVAVNLPVSQSELTKVEVHKFAGDRQLVFHLPVPGSRDNRKGRTRNLCSVKIARLTINRPEDYYETLARLLQFPPADKTEQEFDFSEIEFPYEIRNSTLSAEIEKLLNLGTTRLMIASEQFDIRAYKPNWFQKTKEKVKGWWPF
jgi:hypothetical protein